MTSGDKHWDVKMAEYGRPEGEAMSNGALVTAASEKPIPMVLHCPNCGTQHIDEPQPEKGWTNPPHRSHECQSCDCIWRPADVATEGVLKIETTGKRDWAPPFGHAGRSQVMTSKTPDVWSLYCNCFRDLFGHKDELSLSPAALQAFADKLLASDEVEHLKSALRVVEAVLNTRVNQIRCSDGTPLIDIVRTALNQTPPSTCGNADINREPPERS